MIYNVTTIFLSITKLFNFHIAMAKIIVSIINGITYYLLGIMVVTIYIIRVDDIIIAIILSKDKILFDLE